MKKPYTGPISQFHVEDPLSQYHRDSHNSFQSGRGHPEFYSTLTQKLAEHQSASCHNLASILMCRASKQRSIHFVRNCQTSERLGRLVKGQQVGRFLQWQILTKTKPDTEPAGKSEGLQQTETLPLVLETSCFMCTLETVNAKCFTSPSGDRMNGQYK